MGLELAYISKMLRGAGTCFFLAGAFSAMLFLSDISILLIAVALLHRASGPLIGLQVGIWSAADILRKKPFNKESFPMHLTPEVS